MGKNAIGTLRCSIWFTSILVIVLSACGPGIGDHISRLTVPQKKIRFSLAEAVFEMDIPNPGKDFGLVGNLMGTGYITTRIKQLQLGKPRIPVEKIAALLEKKHGVRISVAQYKNARKLDTLSWHKLYGWRRKNYDPDGNIFTVRILCKEHSLGNLNLAYIIKLRTKGDYVVFHGDWFVRNSNMKHIAKEMEKLIPALQAQIKKTKRKAS